MKKLTNKAKRKLRIRKSVSGTSEKPRLSVYRSNKNIYAQLIDDVNGVTLAGVSSVSIKDSKGKKSDISFEVGKKIAEKALAKKVKNVVFDRGSSKYHGRVKRVADGAREAGLEF